MSGPRPPLYKWLRGKGGNVVGGVLFFGFFLLKIFFGTTIATIFGVSGAAIVGVLYFTSKKRAERSTGVVTSSALSDRLSALAVALRSRADGLEDRFGRKPSEPGELAVEEWNDLRRIAELRRLQPVVVAVDRMAGGTAPDLRRSAEDLDRLAISMRGTKTPYHLDRKHVIQAIVFLIVVAAGGGLLLRLHFISRAYYQLLASAGTTIEGTVVGQTTSEVTRSGPNQTRWTDKYYHRIVEYRIGSDVRRLTERNGSSGSYELAKGMNVGVIYLSGHESDAVLVDDLQGLIDDPRGPAYYFGIGLIIAAFLGGFVVWRMQVERN